MNQSDSLHHFASLSDKDGRIQWDRSNPLIERLTGSAQTTREHVINQSERKQGCLSFSGCYLGLCCIRYSSREELFSRRPPSTPHPLSPPPPPTPTPSDPPSPRRDVDFLRVRKIERSFCLTSRLTQCGVRPSSWALIAESTRADILKHWQASLQVSTRRSASPGVSRGTCS